MEVHELCVVAVRKLPWWCPWLHVVEGQGGGDGGLYGVAMVGGSSGG
jgi:hypothetical protein